MILTWPVWPSRSGHSRGGRCTRSLSQYRSHNQSEEETASVSREPNVQKQSPPSGSQEYLLTAHSGVVGKGCNPAGTRAELTHLPLKDRTGPHCKAAHIKD